MWVLSRRLERGSGAPRRACIRHFRNMSKRGKQTRFSRTYLTKLSKQRVGLHRNLSKILLKLGGSLMCKDILHKLRCLQRRILSSSDDKFQVAWFKEFWTCYKNFILNDISTTTLRSTPFWISKKGRSSILSLIQEKWLFLRYWDKILIRSQARIHKSLTWPIDIDLRSITAESSVSNQKISTINDQINELWPTLGLRSVDQDRKFPTFKGSILYLNPVQPGLQFIQSGPLGKGTLSIIGDLVSVITNPDLVQKLDKIMSDLDDLPFIEKDKHHKDLSSLFTSMFSNHIEVLNRLHLSLLTHFSKKEKGVPYPRYGRLAHFDELGGKKRYIAIGNWIIQGTLRPLHDILMYYLRSLLQDCTYDQDKVFRFYKKYRKKHACFYSIDLTAATDRLPLSTQILIMRLLFPNKNLGKNWGDLIRSLSFSTRVNNRWTSVKYRVGQGIGLYSSWTILAITNHVLVRLAAKQCGYNPSKYPYLVLGDDVVIFGKRVSTRYQEILSSLGVQISKQKSVFPSSVNGLEFASKYINKEGNLRPLPTVLLVKPGLINKIQFLSQVVSRILRDGVREAPDLELLTNSVFGTKLGRHFGDLFVKYFFTSQFCGIKKEDLETGRLPELLSDLNGDQRITLAEDLSTILINFNLSSCWSFLDHYKSRKILIMVKVSKMLFKTLTTRDFIQELDKVLKRVLGPGPDLPVNSYTRVLVFLSHYLKGPLNLGLLALSEKIWEIEEKTRSYNSPNRRSSSREVQTSVTTHEMYSTLDEAFRKLDIKMIDELLIISHSPSSIYSSSYFKKLRDQGVKSLDSRASRVRRWKVYYFIKILEYQNRYKRK